MLHLMDILNIKYLSVTDDIQKESNAVNHFDLLSALEKCKGPIKWVKVILKTEKINNPKYRMTDLIQNASS